MKQPLGQQTRLIESRNSDIDTLQLWFADPESCYLWSGPGLPFPFTSERFRSAIKWRQIDSYSLIADQLGLLAFGQFYLKAGRCHLARLAVSPQYRDAGIGRYFIPQLMQAGRCKLGTRESSLFVWNNNVPAIKCYRSLGFLPAPWPEGDPVLQNLEFMTHHTAYF